MKTKLLLALMACMLVFSCKDKDKDKDLELAKSQVEKKIDNLCGTWKIQSLRGGKVSRNGIPLVEDCTGNIIIERKKGSEYEMFATATINGYEYSCSITLLLGDWQYSPFHGSESYFQQNLNLRFILTVPVKDGITYDGREGYWWTYQFYAEDFTEDSRTISASSITHSTNDKPLYLRLEKIRQ